MFQVVKGPQKTLCEAPFSSANHERLEALSGACRGSHFLMGGHLIGADVVGLHLLSEEANKSVLLSRIEALLVVVSEYHDAQIAPVLGSDMGALPTRWPTGPNAATWVNGIVVSNVAKGLRAAV